MAMAASPVERDVLWVGTEPSEVWRSADAGTTWEQTSRLETLPSSSEWSFPPRPDTHHVRWIACHPLEPERLWVAIEAGALVSTIDGGRTWRDRVAGGPIVTTFVIGPDEARVRCHFEVRAEERYTIGFELETVLAPDMNIHLTGTQGHAHRLRHPPPLEQLGLGPRFEHDTRRAVEGSRHD